MRDYTEQSEHLAYTGLLCVGAEFKSSAVGEEQLSAKYKSLYTSELTGKKGILDNHPETPEDASDIFEKSSGIPKLNATPNTASASFNKVRSSFEVIFKQLDSILEEHLSGDLPSARIEKGSEQRSTVVDDNKFINTTNNSTAHNNSNNNNNNNNTNSNSTAIEDQESDEDLQPLRILPSRALFYNAVSGELKIRRVSSLSELKGEERSAVEAKCDLLETRSLQERSPRFLRSEAGRNTSTIAGTARCKATESLPNLQEVGASGKELYHFPNYSRKSRRSSNNSLDLSLPDELKRQDSANKTRRPLSQLFSLPGRLGRKYFGNSIITGGQNLEEFAITRKTGGQDPEDARAHSSLASQTQDKSWLCDSEQTPGSPMAETRFRMKKNDGIAKDLTKRQTKIDLETQVKEVASKCSVLSVDGSRPKSAKSKDILASYYKPVDEIQGTLNAGGVRAEYSSGLNAAFNKPNELRDAAIDNGDKFASTSTARQSSCKVGGDLNSTSMVHMKDKRALDDVQVLRPNFSEKMSLSVETADNPFLRHKPTKAQLSKSGGRYLSQEVLSRGISENAQARNSQVSSVRGGRSRVLDHDAKKRYSDATLSNLPPDYLQYSPRTLQRMLHSNIADERQTRDIYTDAGNSDLISEATLASSAHAQSNRSSFQLVNSKARDQAQRSSFDKYLRGSSTSMSRGSYVEHSDYGYGGSGGTSPRDVDSNLVASNDHFSSRSDSPNSRSSSALASVDSGVRMSPGGTHSTLVVVAIDFGTTFSGYAFSFTRDPTSIHMMRKWEGGDPGITNQKTPTSLLLKPDGTFRAFGFGARDAYHDLDKSEAKKWLFFDKFKMKLHSSTDLHSGMQIRAANGKLHPALKVFSHSLRFFRDHVLAELSDQSTAKITEEDITWVVTVPAIWRQPAKQFMRTAAYEAGIASAESAERLLIALEPEAASIFCRKLRIRDCVIEDDIKAKSGDDSLLSDDFSGVTQYLVADCGGGTVDLTVHELDVRNGTLKELHKGTGGPSGATGVDREFEKLMKAIFDGDFIERFKLKRPASWVGLMIAFEAKKRTARAHSGNALNITLPFSFIEYHKKKRKMTVESAVKKFKNPDVKWSQEGFLRLSSDVMQQLFDPVLTEIVGHIQDLLLKPSLRHVEYMFLVGGFAESPLLQHCVRDALEGRVRVIIPNDVGLAILKGAVLFGLDPAVVRVRRSAFTYGVGVLHKFDPSKHNESKRVEKDGIVWCKDIFDSFVRVDESVGVGEHVTRSYAPARSGQKTTMINIYCTEKQDVLYTTDDEVFKCGKLRMEMPDVQLEDIPAEKRGKPRELQATMTFGDTEIKVSAVDMLTGRAVKAIIDFLNY